MVAVDTVVAADSDIAAADTVAAADAAVAAAVPNVPHIAANEGPKARQYSRHVHQRNLARHTSCCCSRHSW